MSIIVPNDNDVPKIDKLLSEIFDTINTHKKGNLTNDKLFKYFDERFDNIVDMMILHAQEMTINDKKKFYRYSGYLYNAVVGWYETVQSNNLTNAQINLFKNMRQRIETITNKLLAHKELIYFDKDTDAGTDQTIVYGGLLEKEFDYGMTIIATHTAIKQIETIISDDNITKYMDDAIAHIQDILLAQQDLKGDIDSQLPKIIDYQSVAKSLQTNNVRYYNDVSAAGDIVSSQLDSIDKLIGDDDLILFNSEILEGKIALSFGSYIGRIGDAIIEVMEQIKYDLPTNNNSPIREYILPIVKRTIDDLSVKKVIADYNIFDIDIKYVYELFGTVKQIIEDTRSGVEKANTIAKNIDVGAGVDIRSVNQIFTEIKINVDNLTTNMLNANDLATITKLSNFDFVNGSEITNSFVSSANEAYVKLDESKNKLLNEPSYISLMKSVNNIQPQKTRDQQKKIIETIQGSRANIDRVIQTNTEISNMSIDIKQITEIRDNIELLNIDIWAHQLSVLIRNIEIFEYVVQIFNKAKQICLFRLQIYNFSIIPIEKYIDAIDDEKNGAEYIYNTMIKSVITNDIKTPYNIFINKSIMFNIMNTISELTNDSKKKDIDETFNNLIGLLIDIAEPISLACTMMTEMIRENKNILNNILVYLRAIEVTIDEDIVNQLGSLQTYMAQKNEELDKILGDDYVQKNGRLFAFELFGKINCGFKRVDVIKHNIIITTDIIARIKHRLHTMRTYNNTIDNIIAYLNEMVNGNKYITLIDDIVQELSISDLVNLDESMDDRLEAVNEIIESIDFGDVAEQNQNLSGVVDEISDLCDSISTTLDESNDNIQNIESDADEILDKCNGIISFSYEGLLEYLQSSHSEMLPMATDALDCYQQAKFLNAKISPTNREIELNRLIESIKDQISIVNSIIQSNTSNNVISMQTEVYTYLKELKSQNAYIKQNWPTNDSDVYHIAKNLETDIQKLIGLPKIKLINDALANQTAMIDTLDNLNRSLDKYDDDLEDYNDITIFNKSMQQNIASILDKVKSIKSEFEKNQIVTKDFVKELLETIDFYTIVTKAQNQQNIKTIVETQIVANKIKLFGINTTAIINTLLHQQDETPQKKIRSIKLSIYKCFVDIYKTNAVSIYSQILQNVNDVLYNLVILDCSCTATLLYKTYIDYHLSQTRERLLEMHPILDETSYQQDSANELYRSIQIVNQTMGRINECIADTQKIIDRMATPKYRLISEYTLNEIFHPNISEQHKIFEYVLLEIKHILPNYDESDQIYDELYIDLNALHTEHIRFEQEIRKIVEMISGISIDEDKNYIETTLPETIREENRLRDMITKLSGSPPIQLEPIFDILLSKTDALKNMYPPITYSQMISYEPMYLNIDTADIINENSYNAERNDIVAEQNTTNYIEQGEKIFERDDVNINSHESIVNYIHEYGIEQTSDNIADQLIYKNTPTIQPQMVGNSKYAAFLLVAQQEMLHYKNNGLSIDEMWHNKEFVQDIVRPILEEYGEITYDLLYKEFATQSGLATMVDMESIDDAISKKKRIVDITGKTFGAGMFLANDNSLIKQYHIVPPINIDKSLFAKFMNDDRFRFCDISESFDDFDIILVDELTEPRWLEIVKNKYGSKLVYI